MPSKIHGSKGIERLVKKYRQDFRIRENLDHYSGKDYERAERGYIQFCLKHGGTGSAQIDDVS